MNSVNIYTYERKNIRKIISKIEEDNNIFIDKHSLWSRYTNYKQVIGEQDYFFDISLFFRQNETEFYDFVSFFLDNKDENVFLVINNVYIEIFDEIFYCYIKSYQSLEKVLDLKLNEKCNIVDLQENEFKEVMVNINSKLFGHKKYKLELETALKKFRFFNKIGQQKIFSALLIGQSGVGKTEVARLFHKNLASNEPFIKINFGNYSDANALSSLIGSPRGYIGSEKGELADKILNSNSTIILIDEFEKSSKQVQNFFLELLEDGSFTDSLGRKYDLNKYLIIFTSNATKNNLYDLFSMEILSRFDLIHEFSCLDDEEKKAYAKNRLNEIKQCIKKKTKYEISEVIQNEILNLDYSKYENMRKINTELDKRISNKLYDNLINY